MFFFTYLDFVMMIFLWTNQLAWTCRVFIFVLTTHNAIFLLIEQKRRRWIMNMADCWHSSERTLWSRSQIWMNQLILEDDGICQPQSFRMTLDFQHHVSESLASNLCCHQVESFRPSSEKWKVGEKRKKHPLFDVTLTSSYNKCGFWKHFLIRTF